MDKNSFEGQKEMERRRQDREHRHRMAFKHESFEEDVGLRPLPGIEHRRQELLSDLRVTKDMLFVLEGLVSSFFVEERQKHLDHLDKITKELEALQ